MIIVNNHLYRAKPATLPHNQRVCENTNFYESAHYFIKEVENYGYESPCGDPLNSIRFYNKYYKPGMYPVPLLIEYQKDAHVTTMVYERIHGDVMSDVVRSHQIGISEGRHLLKLILEALLPFEQSQVHHGDVRLKNMMLSEDKVYLIDFDHLDREEDLPYIISTFIYDFGNAHHSQELSNPLSRHRLPEDMSLYHQCCNDILEAIFSDSANTSVSSLLSLMTENPVVWGF